MCPAAYRAFEFIRFGIVGVAATGFFVLGTLMLAGSQTLSPTAATALAYLLAIPVSYAGQRYWTFASQNRVAKEFPRFVVVHGINLAAAAGLMYIVTHLLVWDYELGVAIVALTIPVLSYLQMLLLVFKAPDRVAPRRDEAVVALPKGPRRQKRPADC